jgi:hypothetical protein
MLPHNRTQCCPQFAHLSEYAACGLKNIWKFAADMKADTDAMPDDLKPYMQELSNIILEALIESYAECLRLIPELAYQEITREARLPNHHTEQTY